MSQYTLSISFEKVTEAASRLNGRLHRTPVMTSHLLDALSPVPGRQFFFKCEHLQRTGSFKARGALNAVLSLLEEAEKEGASKKPAGVVTHSSGNHGQALAWAARECGLPCTVVVPEGTSPAKTAAIRGYGAELIQCAPNMRARRETCAQLAEQRDYHVVAPFDDYRVMAGQGTVALELMEQAPGLDAVLVPISGGGLSSGVAIASRHLRPQLRVFCVEPSGKRLADSLSAGKRLWPNPDAFLATIADGLRLQSAGELTFPVLLDHVAPDAVLPVTDAQMSTGCRLALRYLKQLIEPASGAALAAAVLSASDQLPAELRRVGVVLTGGNVDPDGLPDILAASASTV